MSDNVLSKLDAYDLVFDMQCFHVLRTIDQDRISRVMHGLLKPGGHIIVVVGALDSELESKVRKAGFNGPPQLTKAEVTEPFEKLGLSLLSLQSSRFNMTPHYKLLGEPPLCWVALFQKKQGSSDGDDDSDNPDNTATTDHDDNTDYNDNNDGGNRDDGNR